MRPGPGPPGHQPPLARLPVTPAAGSAPLAVTANASASSDPDGTIASYRFDFGDGTVVCPQAAATATHTYAAGSWPARAPASARETAGDASRGIRAARGDRKRLGILRSRRHDRILPVRLWRRDD